MSSQENEEMTGSRIPFVDRAQKEFHKQKGKVVNYHELYLSFPMTRGFFYFFALLVLIYDTMVT